MTDSTITQPVRPKVRKRTKVAMIVLCLLVASVVFCTYAVHRVSSHADRVMFSVSDAPRRPVVLVLGARVDQQGNPSSALEDRLLCALDLYRRGKAEYILVSGDHGRDGYDEVNGMHAWLVARGVSRDKIYLDHAGFRTLDSVARAQSVFAVRSMAICTQQFHLPRSLWLANALGVEAVGVIADRRVYQKRRRDAVREWFAQTRAFLDTQVFQTQPRFVGPRIPIGMAPAQLTHDQNTAN